MIRVVDIFAGPGGLSEGFSSAIDSRRNRAFDVVLSVEKENYAFETLKLRAFYRQFPEGAPHEYYRYLRGEIAKEALYDAYPHAAQVASAKCWHAILGPGGVTPGEVRDRINTALGHDDEWVLIGGPPCQAYSLAGRSRNHGNPDYNPTEDVRQRLYVEYLQILADHRPVIFVMENVKGLLSATLQNEHIFKRILNDLRNPLAALERENRNIVNNIPIGYNIYSLVERRLFENGNLEGSVIKSENYGIPQARHRVILLGIRQDLTGVTPPVLVTQPFVPISQVIGRLPKLRSGLSRTADSAEAWVNCLGTKVNSRWANAGTRKIDGPELSILLRGLMNDIVSPPAGRGGEFVRADVGCDYRPDWYCDPKLEGVCNHSTTGHMEKDLYRYFYAACYAKLHDKSPNLKDFPKDLLPNHTSVETALKQGDYFSDRFRVQVFTRPSTTIVSHISKDGHYYIHPDPLQCRSFTVREAARIQTFPDNYFFCGPQTHQFTQVGNAVPPLLARQIAMVVYDVLHQGGIAN